MENNARRALACLTIGLNDASAQFVGYCTEGLLVSAPLFPFGELPDDFMSRTRLYSLPNSSIGDVLCATARPEERRFAALILSSVFEKDKHALLGKLRECGYEYRPYVSYYDALVVSAASPLADKKKVSFADLLGQTIAVTHGIISEIVGELFDREEVGLICGDSYACMQLVRSGRAITFRPGFATWVHEVEGVVSVALENSYRMEIGLVAKPSLFADEEFSVFSKTLMNLHNVLAGVSES